jgi:V8-like Glu-specific endopeptidase
VLFANLISAPSSSAIYAGTNATGTSYVVKVTSPNGSCSGALISPQIVATAAHCVVRSGVAVRPEDLKIYSPGADTNISSTYSTGYAVFYPSTFLNNNTYTEPNDAAFIVLNQKIENSKPLVLANYNTLQSIISSGNPIYIFGYGATIRNGFSSNIPYSFRAKPTAQVRIFGFQGYERTYTSYINDYDGATCPGDSGGPGISEYKGVSYLVSINSGGVGPCSGDSSQGSWRSNATIAGEYQYLLDKANALLATLKPAEVLSPSIVTTSMSGLISWTPPQKSPAAITAYVVKDDSQREICRTSTFSCEVTLKVGVNIFKIYSVAGSILSDGVVIEYETQNAVPPAVEEIKTYETYVKVIWGEISDLGNATESSVEIIIQDGLSKETLCKAQAQTGECTFPLLPKSFNLELILNSNIAMTLPMTVGRFSGITQLSLISRTKNNLAYLTNRVKSLIVSNPGYAVELNALLTATPTLNENFEYTDGKLQEILDLSNQTSELVTRIASFPRKITITCVKGKLTKKVIAVKPTCPAGYIKK